MQFKKPFKEAIRRGEITSTIRNWKAPRAKVGGRYNLHPLGAIEVTHIKRLPARQIRPTALKRAGFADLESLLGYVDASADDELYQVDFDYLGDLRVKVPPTTALSDAERRQLKERLDRLDARSSRGPWAWRTLALISAHPGTRAADLAQQLRFETQPFKSNVQKLKRLGLTESLEIGYRLSNRGSDLLREAP